MNRIIKSFFIPCLISALCVSLLSGCEAQQKTDPDTLRIGVAVYQQSDTFINELLNELEHLAQEKETDENIKINLNIVDGHGSQLNQSEQIDRFIALDYDVLCVNIVDRTSAAMIIDKAREADIPIIFFNREPVREDIERWDSVYYIGAKAEESGILQGQILLNTWLNENERVDRNQDGVLQYVMLEGEPGHQDAMLRTEYAVKTLVEAGVPVEKLDSNTANWDRSQAASRMSHWMEQIRDSIEVVISNNDDMALGAIDVFENLEIPQEEMPVVVGVDATELALEAVCEGTMQGTVRNDAKGIAESMLNLALDLELGRDSQELERFREGQYIWLPYRKVTKQMLKCSQTVQP